MKQLISALAICSLIATSCSKEISAPPVTPSSTGVADSIASATAKHGNDDTKPDDHGGKGGNDNGTRVSAAAVPSAVIMAFTAKYSGPTGVEWKKLSSGNYKVEFFLGSTKVQTTFSAAGILLKEERR